MALFDDLVFYNPWWVRKSVPEGLVEEFKRPDLLEVIGLLDSKRIVVIKGARRVGKTTLLYQLIDFLFSKDIQPENVLFLSLDDPKVRVGLEEIFQVYEERVLKKPLGECKQVFVILDEVQFMKEWELQVKKFFDRKYPITFIVSGSSSTLIRRGTESLVGRTIERVISPFSFKEFFEFKTKKSSLVNTELDAKAVENQARILFNEYLTRGGIPSTFELSEEKWVNTLKEDVIKVIYRDITQLHEIRQPEALEKLLLYIADNTGGITNINSVANTIGTSREYAEKYVNYLKTAFLAFSIPIYSENIAKRVRRGEKMYIADTGVANAMLNKNTVDETRAGKLVETIIASHLASQGVKYYRNGFEIDFIAKNTAIEVKYQNSPSVQEIKKLKTMADELGLEKKIMVTKNTLETTDGVELIPAWLFLLKEKN